MIIEGNKILFRQSWLGDAIECPERGRQKLIRPEWDEASGDAAVVGTGMHGGAEVRLQGGTIEEAIENVHRAIDEDVAERGITFKTYTSLDEVHAYGEACFHGWEKHLFPQMVEADLLGHPTEVNFEVPMFDWESPWGDVYSVGITGTADYPTPVELWDWKSAKDKRRYSPRSKQKHAVQPSVYGAAAVRGAFGFDMSYPLTFKYGVVIRPSTPREVPDAIVTPVWRGVAHERLLVRKMHEFLNLWGRMGLDTPWPTDMEIWLCSEKWCPWYSVCRGAYVSAYDDDPDNLPNTPIAVGKAA